MTQFSAYLLDQLLAPGVSEFRSADIPDMSSTFSQSPYWVSNFFLNGITNKFKEPMHAFAHNYLRRASNAFFAHHEARTATLEFLGSGGQSPSKYSEAMFHWENFLNQSWLGYALLAKAFQGQVFVNDDGSPQQRLNRLYNQAKHAEQYIADGLYPTDSTLTVWLETAGLRSVNTKLSFVETGEILSDLGQYAEVLQDPKTAGQRIKFLP